MAEDFYKALWQPFPQSEDKAEQQAIRRLLQAGWNRVHTSLALHIDAMQGILFFSQGGEKNAICDRTIF